MKKGLKLNDALILVAVIVVVLGVIVGAALKVGKSEYDALSTSPVATPAATTATTGAPVIAE